MADYTISLITEGPTDQIVLESIIVSFTGDKDILFTPLQPKPGEAGNWDKVFKYCGSNDFKAAFSNEDLIAVIQIDTDILLSDGLPVQYRIPHIEQMKPLQLLDEMRKLLIAEIGLEHYESFGNRIIFAVAVAEIECWFLAIYHPKAKAAKTANCIKLLNEKLYAAEGFYIDAKYDVYYRKICRHFKKKNDLIKYSQPNISFKAFLQELEVKLPDTIQKSIG